MAHEIVMPRLGWSAEEGSLVEWLKQDGATVEVGEIVCTVEGDKAISEVESLDRGVLRIPPDAPPPGVKVPVGTILAYLVAAGEAAPFERGLTPRPSPAELERGAGTGAERPSLPLASGAGEGGRGVRPVALSAMESVSRRDEPPISPRARRIAAELGVRWNALTGSGRSGRIVERDVRAAAGLTPSSLADGETEHNGDGAPEIPGSPPHPVPASATPLSGLRKIVAERLAESARTVAPVTLTTEADATELVRWRGQLKADRVGTDEVVPTYNDLLAKVVAVALREHPRLNSSLVGNAIVEHPTANVGIAVDTARGLLVPVIRDVAAKPVQQIAEEAARLIGQARSGRISADDLRGGTFTITNLGPYEVDRFTPIVNLPECAILGVGRIVARPVVVDEETERVAVRRMLALSLTFDHRLVDGAPAARFLQRVKHLVEHPTLGLLR